MKNKQHKSLGVAFIQFNVENEAVACLELDNTQVKNTNNKFNILTSFFEMSFYFSFKKYSTDVWANIENKHSQR